MATKVCRNTQCGKEYDYAMEKCPHCGTPNEKYVPVQEHDETAGQKFKRYAVVGLVGVFTLFVWSLISVECNINRGSILFFLGLGVVLSICRGVNSLLKQRHKK